MTSRSEIIALFAPHQEALTTIIRDAWAETRGTFSEAQWLAQDRNAKWSVMQNYIARDLDKTFGRTGDVRFVETKNKVRSLYIQNAITSLEVRCKKLRRNSMTSNVRTTEQLNWRGSSLFGEIHHHVFVGYKMEESEFETELSEILLTRECRYGVEVLDRLWSVTGVEVAPIMVQSAILEEVADVRVTPRQTTEEKRRQKMEG